MEGFRVDVPGQQGAKLVRRGYGQAGQDVP